MRAFAEWVSPSITPTSKTNRREFIYTPPRRIYRAVSRFFKPEVFPARTVRSVKPSFRQEIGTPLTLRNEQRTHAHSEIGRGRSQCGRESFVARVRQLQNSNAARPTMTAGEKLLLERRRRGTERAGAEKKTHLVCRFLHAHFRGRHDIAFTSFEVRVTKRERLGILAALLSAAAKLVKMWLANR